MPRSFTLKLRVMWFLLGCKNFIGKKYFENESCEIFVTDFIRVWHKSLSNNELLSISQELNPLLEASVQKIKDITGKLLEDVKIHKDIIEESDGVLIRVKSNIMNFKFQFQVKLNPGDTTMLYKEFTLPAMLTLKKMQERENELLHIIQQKDAEIKEFKQEYDIKASYLTTETFCKKEFDCRTLENLPCDFVSLIECISTSNLSFIESSLESQSVNSTLEKNLTATKSDVKEPVFKDKNKTSSKDVGMLFNNQILKKRKKYKEDSKIKF